MISKIVTAGVQIMTKSTIKLAYEIGLFIVLFMTPTQANTIIVGPLGSEADYSKIQEAIDVANCGDTIQVLSGIYQENVFVDKALVLKGEDDGSGMPVVDACDSGCPMTLSADGTVIEGFELINSGSSWMHAGILVESNNNTITKNSIHDNSIYGLVINNANNNIITNNKIYNNTVGVGIFSSNETFITENDIISNEEGIEVRLSDRTTIDEGNEICNNTYGICYDSYSRPKSDLRDPIMKDNIYDYYPTNELVPIGYPVGLPPWGLTSSEGDEIYWDEYDNYSNKVIIFVM